MNLSARTYISFSITAVLCVSLATAACDVTVVSPLDASVPDANVLDAKADSNTQLDAANDSAQLDGSANDGGRLDGGGADGGGSDGGGADAGPSTAVADFYTRYVNAFCASKQNCCPNGFEGVPFSLAACKTDFIDGDGHYYNMTGLRILNTPAKQRNLRINAAKASACLAITAAAACANTAPGRGFADGRSAVLDCASAIEGTLVANAPCAADLECSTDLFCAAGVGGAASTCKPLNIAGEACVRVAPAFNSQYSDSCSNHATGDTNLFCPNGVCVPLSPAGGPCAIVQDCAAGLTCTANGTCGSILLDDSTCFINQ